MIWLARRIVLSVLIPFAWRWWRGRRAGFNAGGPGYTLGGGTQPPHEEETTA